MRKVSVLLLAIVPCLYAQEGRHCRDVSGAILTNFIDPTTTLGTATGDLKGGLGVTVLGVKPGPNGSSIYHVHHHWVTETGETLLFEDAYLTAILTTTGLILADYVDGINMTGGTGRFAGASGKSAAWGAIDPSKGQLVLRYDGQVCFARDSGSPE
jgi:hypothetical protein